MKLFNLPLLPAQLDILTISGVVSGWIALFVAIAGMYVSVKSERTVNRLLGDLIQSRKAESSRVDRLIGIMSKSTRRKR